MTAPTNLSMPATYVPAGASMQTPTPPTCAPAPQPCAQGAQDDPLAEAARLLRLSEKAAGTDVSNQLAAIADRWLTIAGLR